MIIVSIIIYVIVFCIAMHMLDNSDDLPKAIAVWILGIFTLMFMIVIEVLL